MRASVLSFGRTPKALIEFGVDIVEDPEQITDLMNRHNYHAFFYGSENQSCAEIQKIFREVDENSGNIQILLHAPNLSAEDLRILTNTVRIFKILRNIDDTHLTALLQEAIEESALIQQNNNLFKMLEEQNETLERVKGSLERRLKDRQSIFSAAKKRLSGARERTEVFQKILVALNAAQSIGDVEARILPILEGFNGIKDFRIFLEGHPRPPSTESSILLGLPEPAPRGSVILFRQNAAEKIRRSERELYKQISESVAFAVSRLLTHQKLEEIRFQWEATFDAFHNPVALITEDYDVVQSNKAFGATNKGKCYQVLFDRDQPCADCSLGSPFSVRRQDPSEVIYEVASHVLWSEKKKKVFFHMYTDVTDRLKTETKLLESAREAELGLIGGSIAHELNNPLGGMLAILQLVQMEAEGNPPWLEDVREMEAATKKCKQIVENILEYSRKASTDGGPIPLNDVISRVSILVELQARSHGIQINLENVAPEIQITQVSTRGLPQGVLLVLQHLISQLGFSMGKERKSSLQLFVATEIANNHLHLTFVPETLTEDLLWGPISEDQSLRTAKTILKTLGGDLEFFSSTKDEVAARITIPRPVFLLAGPNL